MMPDRSKRVDKRDISALACSAGSHVVFISFSCSHVSVVLLVSLGCWRISALAEKCSTHWHT